MSGLTLSGVTLRLAGRTLLGPLDLRVAPGEIATVMGPSGGGKSTLLAFLCGTLDPAFAAEGTAALDGVALTGLPPEKRRVGILFQDDLLFPHLSVGGNLAFALPREVKDRAGAVAAALAEAELPGYENRDPATLSGGQRARVALMRALLARPRAILLDEPFAKLDAELRGRMRDFVFAHIGARNIPCLLVTHDPEDARAAGGPIVRL
ncbi:MAG: ATP-binding cassette domain-containing protein [Azospirillum sp.]|nr:ATP-binding cassette domain-containing protein [Azospirillum sp.]MCA3268232.1 ATP-binding cassette domain-containing protein [Azospirillum sp.]